MYFKSAATSPFLLWSAVRVPWMQRLSRTSDNAFVASHNLSPSPSTRQNPNHPSNRKANTNFRPAARHVPRLPKHPAPSLPQIPEKPRGKRWREEIPKAARWPSAGLLAAVQYREAAARSASAEPKASKAIPMFGSWPFERLRKELAPEPTTVLRNRTEGRVQSVMFGAGSRLSCVTEGIF